MNPGPDSLPLASALDTRTLRYEVETSRNKEATDEAGILSVKSNILPISMALWPRCESNGPPVIRDQFHITLRLLDNPQRACHYSPQNQGIKKICRYRRVDLDDCATGWGISLELAQRCSGFPRFTEGLTRRNRALSRRQCIHLS